MKRELMVFAKAPIPGTVKTRLVPTLSEAQAAQVHAAFVRDVVERHQRPDRLLTLWTGGDHSHAFWDTFAGIPRTPQPKGDLGDRMAYAFRATLKKADSVVILGTDSPTLPPKIVDQAFTALETVDAVIGPACDGGYYLLGLRQNRPIFDNIPWGTETVLVRTLAKLKTTGCTYHMLPFWYDVDRPVDLALLEAHVPILAAQGGQPPTHTIKALRW